MPANKPEDQKTLILDVQHLFGTEQGKRVWKHLEDVCYMNGTTFDKEPLRMAFNEGVRSLLLHLKTLKEIDVIQYENNQKEQENHDG